MASENNRQDNGAIDETEATNQTNLPFNNLFLNSGVVNGLNQAWMYVMTFSLALLGYFLYQGVIAFPLLERLLRNGFTADQIQNNPNLLLDSNALRMDPNTILVLELGMFVFALLGLFIGVQFIHRKVFRSILTGYSKFRFKRFWYAFFVWTIMQLIFTTVSYLLAPEHFELVFNLKGWLISALIMIVLMPLQTGFEEAFFRAYFVQGLAQIFKNGWIPVIIMSLLFALAHMSNPEVKKFGVGVMFVFYAAFALFLGFLTLLDEGIELAFGIHFANNIVSSLLVSNNDSVIKTYAIYQTDNFDPTVEIFAWLAMATLSFLIFRMRFRWTDYKLLIK